LIRFALARTHLTETMFDRKIIIVTPWFGRFAGGAELLARGMAREFNKRGVRTTVFTTCSRSPYDSWWEDYYQPGVYDVAGIETNRFATVKSRARYDAVIRKLRRGSDITTRDEQDFFNHGINSADLVEALRPYTDGDFEILAVPYFHGLTHAVINKYPGKVSVVPCFHNEPQFYWRNTETLLRNAKLIFFNSAEEKQMTIRRYGHKVGRRIIEGAVTGVGVESARIGEEEQVDSPELPSNYFVYAGRKEAGKNVPLLCQWFAGYIEKFRSAARLVFIGGGDKSLVPSSDLFVDLGFVSEGTKREVFRRSTGIINLSENESFSLVLMEGWLVSVPAVVSASCAVTASHVRRCNGGLYVANSDEFGLALRTLEEHEAIRKQLGANGKEYVRREFSFDAVLSRYLKEFQRQQNSETGNGFHPDISEALGASPDISR
jgi:glycosyltransferase involved in cell wall biosynthesis